VKGRVRTVNEGGGALGASCFEGHETGGEGEVLLVYAKEDSQEDSLGFGWVAAGEVVKEGANGSFISFGGDGKGMEVVLKEVDGPKVHKVRGLGPGGGLMKVRHPYARG
jgi:hypothetical protein